MGLNEEKQAEEEDEAAAATEDEKGERAKNDSFIDWLLY